MATKTIKMTQMAPGKGSKVVLYVGAYKFTCPACDKTAFISEALETVECNKCWTYLTVTKVFHAGPISPLPAFSLMSELKKKSHNAGDGFTATMSVDLYATSYSWDCQGCLKTNRLNHGLYAKVVCGECGSEFEVSATQHTADSDPFSNRNGKATKWISVENEIEIDIDEDDEDMDTSEEPADDEQLAFLTVPSHLTEFN